MHHHAIPAVSARKDEGAKSQFLPRGNDQCGASRFSRNRNHPKSTGPAPNPNRPRISPQGLGMRSQSEIAARLAPSHPQEHRHRSQSRVRQVLPQNGHLSLTGSWACRPIPFSANAGHETLCFPPTVLFHPGFIRPLLRFRSAHTTPLPAPFTPRSRAPGKTGGRLSSKAPASKAPAGKPLAKTPRKSPGKAGPALACAVRKRTDDDHAVPAGLRHFPQLRFPPCAAFTGPVRDQGCSRHRQWFL